MDVARSGPMRIVLDTDVLVAGLESPDGVSRVLIDLALAGRLDLLLSNTLLTEYEAVLTRPERLAASGLARDDVGTVLDALALTGRRVYLDYRLRPTGSDPDDDLVLETAVNGVADCIATFNLRHLRAAAARFGIAAMRPGTLLRRIR